jgi:hypothetical protein
MLDNTAKISDIISSLQESEGINQKAELKSNLTAQDVEVLDADDMATLVSKVKDIKRFKLGMTEIVDSSHPTTDAPIDLDSVRLEFYTRVIPKDLLSIRIYKNGVTNVFNNAVINTGSTNTTDIESVYIRLSENMYPDTDYKIVLPTGCMKDKLGNDIQALEYNFHTNPNPSVWVNNPNGLLTGRESLAGCGTQNAGLSFGGYNSDKLAITEKFNSTTWSTTGSLNNARYRLAGCGTQGAGLSFGGSTGSILPYTEKFNGSSWTTSADLNRSVRSLAGCGTQTAGLAFGGTADASSLNITEKFNGTTWSTTGVLNTARESLAGCGTQNAGLSFGGYKSASYQAITEKFNGTTWSTTGVLNTARESLAGCGTQGAGLSFGGSTGSILPYTEKFNGTTWSTTGSLNNARYRLAGCGTQSAALSFGGSSNSSTYIGITEKFFG